MECPYCNSELHPGEAFSEDNNPNLVTCESCSESIFVHIEYEMYQAVKKFGQSTFECNYSCQLN
jgi:transcription elongation factor Elf1